jgi:hypothetical protein
MNQPKLVSSFAITLLLLGACDKKPEASGADSTVATAAPASPAGGVVTVDVTTSGTGPTRDEAIRDAVIRAVEQVHGRAISVSNVSRELGTITTRKDVNVAGVGAGKEESITATEGGRQLSESTQGLVTAIRVIEEDEGRSSWTVKVTASVAKFMPPNANKLRVVVGQPRGDGRVDLDAEAAAMLRERVTAAINATGKVALLDRDASSDVDAELALAGSGAASGTESLKQGQMQVADVVVQLTVQELSVNRQSRTLRMSQREIVSYSGRAAATYKIVHVATRQVLSTGEAKASRSSGEALRDEVSATAWKRDMLEEMSKELAAKAAEALVPEKGADSTTRN